MDTNESIAVGLNTTPAETAKRITAFAKLAALKTDNGAHRIRPKAVTDKDNLTVTFKLADIGNSKTSKLKVDAEGKESGGKFGFMCEPIEFTAEGQTFSLNPGWITIKAKKS